MMNENLAVPDSAPEAVSSSETQQAGLRQPIRVDGTGTEGEWHPPDNPTSEQISEAATLIGMIDRIAAPMNVTGWQEPDLGPREIIEEMSLLSYQVTIPVLLLREARRRAQKVLDQARACGRL